MRVQIEEQKHLWQTIRQLLDSKQSAKGAACDGSHSRIPDDTDRPSRTS